MMWLSSASPLPRPRQPTSWDERATIEVKTGRGITTLVINGELDLATMPLLARQLALVLRDNPGRLVFDLARTEFIDCGSARLIASSGPGGRRPVIRHPAPGVRRIFKLTGLDHYCEIEG